MPTPPTNIKIIQYAYDISVYTAGTNIATISTNINQFISHIMDYLTEQDLIVSPEKSMVTLFTSDTKEVNINPEVKIQGQAVKLDKNPKLFGVSFDTIFNFTVHVKNTVAKAKTKVNVLKALAGSTWGQDRETLLIIYKSICWSMLEYVAPVWAPLICQSNWDRLQECNMRHSEWQLLIRFFNSLPLKLKAKLGNEENM